MTTNNIQVLYFDALETKLYLKNINNNEYEFATQIGLSKPSYLSVGTISIEGQNFYIIYSNYVTAPGVEHCSIMKDGKILAYGNYIICRKGENKFLSLTDSDIELILRAFSPKPISHFVNNVISLSVGSSLNVSEGNNSQFIITLSNKDGSVLYN